MSEKEEEVVPRKCPFPECSAGEQNKENLEQFDKLRSGLTKIGKDMEDVKANQVTINGSVKESNEGLKKNHEGLESVRLTIVETMGGLNLHLEKILNLKDTLDVFMDKAEKTHEKLYGMNHATEEEIKKLQRENADIRVNYVSKTDVYKFIAMVVAIMTMLNIFALAAYFLIRNWIESALRHAGG